MNRPNPVGIAILVVTCVWAGFFAIVVLKTSMENRAAYWNPEGAPPVGSLEEPFLAATILYASVMVFLVGHLVLNWLAPLPESEREVQEKMWFVATLMRRVVRAQPAPDFQFLLRTLLLFVLAVSVFLGLLFWRYPFLR